MAIRLNAAGDTLDLTTGLPSNTSFTLMIDQQTVADMGGTTQPIFWALNAGNTDGYAIYWDNNSDVMAMQAFDAAAVSSNSTFSSRPAIGSPFCVFLRCSGTAAGQFTSGWKYPGRPWQTVSGTMAATVAQVATLWLGGILATYTADKRIQNFKAWDRALSDAELTRESESTEVVFRGGLNCHFPLPNLGDLRDRGPKGKSLARGGTMETEYFDFPRSTRLRKIPVPYEAPVGGGGTFQILAGPRFSLAGAHGLAGD